MQSSGALIAKGTWGVLGTGGTWGHRDPWDADGLGTGEPWGRGFLGT